MAHHIIVEAGVEIIVEALVELIVDSATPLAVHPPVKGTWRPARPHAGNSCPALSLYASFSPLTHFQFRIAPQAPPAGPQRPPAMRKWSACGWPMPERLRLFCAAWSAVKATTPARQDHGKAARVSGVHNKGWPALAGVSSPPKKGQAVPQDHRKADGEIAGRL